jgi:plasmid stability protein
MIQIRNVPDEIHRKLKVRAASEGVTLSDLLAREARRLAEEPSSAELWERILSRTRVSTKVSSARAVRQAREKR